MHERMSSGSLFQSSEDGRDVITLPRGCNQSVSCIVHRLKLFDDVFRDII